MLIVSWNVAGLSTTVNRIYDSYGKLNNKKPSVALSEYFERHGADIVCIQEHKIPLSQLSSRSEPLNCASIENYESFWSCCVDSKKKGLNGVVTYVKKGVGVVSANSTALGSADLDEQGRCIMTDHGKFVLFNVYVPASSGQPLSYKMKFLNALRRAMKEQRKKQKHVILVGDLNISHAKLDKFWSDRVLFINDIQKEVLTGVASSLPTWKLDLAKAWPRIEEALRTKEVVPTQTTNSLTKKTYNKYRMMVQVDGKKVFLGSHESDPRYCEFCYDFESSSYICAEEDKEILSEEENVACVSVVIELMEKIAGIRWDEATQRQVGEEAGASRVSPTRKWLNGILYEDGMVDAFRHYYSLAEGRYSNEGARIDYTLLDRSLLTYLQKGNVDSLRSCSGDEDPNTEAAALAVATANNSFRPVSFEGGGIVEADQRTLDTQFGTPHTGMIYTPPSFSDHIATSLLLHGDCCSPEFEVNSADPTTRKTQPHKTQKSIKSFFGTALIKTTNTEPSSNSKIGRTQPEQRRGSIRHFFDPTSTGTRAANQVKRPRLNTSTVKKPSILNHFRPKK
eukprot:scaffold11032_cov122-Cylindrotheca_fusiformis.AAC.18